MTRTAVKPDMAAASARRLRIDIAVHGRFHAFHLARALIARGHDVRVLTNYPAWAVVRFGIPTSRVVSFLAHGLATRLHGRLFGRWNVQAGLPALHRAFGRWAALNVRADSDLVYIFSSVAEETLRKFHDRATPKVWLVRGSAHIRTQSELLEAEQVRANVPLDKPSKWSIAREEREYALAERILTLSTFSLRTFSGRPELAGKVRLLLSAVDATRFKPDPSVIASRLQRILSGVPLRVLTVGSFSFRKGALDICNVAQELRSLMKFRFVGDLPAETKALRDTSAGSIEFISRVPEFDLINHYAWADIFLFPTIEDGFPAVVAQALAARLPILTTANGSGLDLIQPDANGWLVPARNPGAISARLRACDSDRAALAQIVANETGNETTRDWNDMASDLECCLVHGH